MVSATAYHIRRNPNAYAVINYMACQDGFTMNDMVTYNYRHNEANQEKITMAAVIIIPGTVAWKGQAEGCRSDR